MASTEIGVFSGFAADLGGAFEAAQGGARKLYGYAEHSLNCTFLGTSTGLRLRHDQPSGKVELNAKSADLARSAWAGCGTRDFTDVDVASLDAGLEQRLDWAQRKIDLPPGRYETLLPPGAVADLLVYMYWSAGAKDALDGRSVFSKPGGGTRVGERLSGLPLTLYSDPALPGLACSPFVVAHASRRDASVFDNGLGLERTDWIRDGELAALIQTRHTAGALRAAGHPRRRQPRPGRPAGFGGVPGGHGGPHRAGPPAHLPLVHPRGGPADPAADRAHPGRHLPGGER